MSIRVSNNVSYLSCNHDGTSHSPVQELQNVDLDGFYAVAANYDSETATYGLYGKDGMLCSVHIGMDDNTDYQNLIAKNLDPTYVKYQPAAIAIPDGGEPLKDAVRQQAAVNAENTAAQAAIKAQEQQYDSYSTPIADEMDKQLSGLTSGLMDIGNIAPVNLSETVIAYDKALSEINDTYSDESIASRASNLSVSDIQAYTDEQLKTKDAEMYKLNSYYIKDTAENLRNYTDGLKTVLNTGNSSDESCVTQGNTVESVIDLTNELSDLYSEYKSENNVDYSAESVDDIASQFSNYSLDKARNTVDINGTTFTYKDMYYASAVLNTVESNETFRTDAGNNSYLGTNYGALQAALGASEVSYVAQNYMTSDAGNLLTQSYDKVLQKEENEYVWTVYDPKLLYLSDQVKLLNSCGVDVRNSPYSLAYNSLQDLDVSSAQAFESSYSDTKNEYISAESSQFIIGPKFRETIEKLQNSYDAFADKFLN